MKVAGNQFELTRPKTTLTKKFKFAKVFDDAATNEAVYSQEISPQITSSLRSRQSITVVAFGARGTGKTRTMRAKEGVAMRAVDDVFDSIAGAADAMVSLSILMSAVTPPVTSTNTGKQFTHEVLLDGMLPGGESAEAYRGGLHVREHPRTGFFVEDLTELSASTREECRELLARGLANCAAEEARIGTGPGAPLRIHCLVTLRVRARAPDGEESCVDVQVLDLAGWVRDKPAPRGKGAPAPQAVSPNPWTLNSTP